MKQILFAAALVLASSSAWADGPSDPIIEPEVIVADTVSSGGGDDWVVIFMAIITVGLGIVK